MEVLPSVRSSLLGILLQVVKLSVLVSGGGDRGAGDTHLALHSYLSAAGLGNLS